MAEHTLKDKVAGSVTTCLITSTDEAGKAYRTQADTTCV